MDNLIKWSGEENFKEYFGLRGFKCLSKYFLSEINKIKVLNGLKEVEWKDFLLEMDNLMEEYKNEN